ncbi:MAG: hypothetical protein R3C11_07635 [Planctomycetaceae bacterium]
MRLKINLWVSVVLGLVAFSLPGQPVSADELRLESGLLLKGQSKLLRSLDNQVVNTFRKNDDPREGEFQYNPIIEIEDNIRRYYISDNMLAADGRKIEGEMLSAFDFFKVPQPISSRKKIRLQTFRGVGKITSFNQEGQREVTLLTSSGDQIQVIQGITFLHPRYVTVKGLNYDWDVTLSTKSIPADVLKSLLQAVVDPDDAKMQRSIARFYLQADRVYEAYQHLEELEKNKSAQNEDYTDVIYEVRQQLALKIFSELQNRRRLGQFELAYQSIQEMPKQDIAPDLQFEIDEFLKQYAVDHDRLGSVAITLAELQSQLKSRENDPQLNLIRRLVTEELSMASLPRLNSFFELQADSSLSAEEKLALAYTGWILGSDAAENDLGLALNLWQARFLIYDYLRSSEPEAELVSQIKSIESLNAERLTRLLQNLPPVPTSSPITGGGKYEMQLIDEVGNTMNYTVHTPLEYSPFRQYPLVIALPPTGGDLEMFQSWWGGNAESPGETMRRGYLLVVPQFQMTPGLVYNHNLLELQRIHQALLEVRRQFSVNSDKVFIAGIADGGDAAIDSGLLHPDVYAGVIGIRGRHAEEAMHYWDNGLKLPWYLVGGEYDGRHSRLLNKMFQLNSNLVYAQYINRASEWYREELEPLFDWMDLQSRKLDAEEVSYEAFMPQDEIKVDWIQARGMEAGFATLNTRRRTIPLEAKMTSPRGESTTLQVTKTLGTGHTFWISPRLHDFNQQLVLKVKGSQKMKEFISPDLEVILNDFRTRYDRQEIYWAKYDF